MSTIKNYRNYLPVLGLIITYVLMRIWDNSDYLSIEYDKVFIYILFVNPIVFGFLSILLNAIRHRCNKKYTESTFAILIQLILYFCGLISSDDIGATLITAYFAYIITIEFFIMLVFYVIDRIRKIKINS